MNELVGIPNPFRDTIVTDAWSPSSIDVPEIHAKVFKTCCDALETVHREQRSNSVLIHGEPGSGKTHLLARLRLNWLGDGSRGVDPILQEVVFVAVHLHTGPQRLWRYLRRSVVGDLLRRIDGQVPQLERILLRRFGEFREADADMLLWWEWLKQEYTGSSDLKEILNNFFDHLDRDLSLGRDLCAVFGHLLNGQHLRDAQAWLLGDPLPESALNSMGLVGTNDDDDQEDEARRVVLALCRLAGPKVAVVLCFDQIEALQMDRKDRSGLFAFGQLVMTLYQQANNVFLISCVQSTFVDQLRDSAYGAAWAHMAIHQAALNPLMWDDAIRLVQARMSVQPKLAHLREAHPDRLWPLNESRLKQEIGNLGCTAEDPFRFAEIYDAASRGLTTPGLSSDEFVSQTWEVLLERSIADTSTPPDDILAHGLPLLVHTAGQPWSVRSDHHLRDIEVMLEGPDARLAISLCNHRDLRGLWPRLRRLPNLIKSREIEKLILLRDIRLPIGDGAAKVKEYLKDLTDLGAHFIRPSPEALAALDALRRLLSDASAGDLSNRGETVEPQTVQRWLAANMPKVLEDFLEEVVSYTGITVSDETNDLFDRLEELLGVWPVVEADKVASRLQVPIEELAETLRSNPRCLGILDGPPVVIFRLVPDEIDSE